MISKMTPKQLALAWKRYIELFGEPPHGTEKQMAALLELVKPDATTFRRIENA